MRFLPNKIIFLLLFVICYLLFATRPVLAQTDQPASPQGGIPQNTHNYVQTVMVDVAAALTCQLSGIDPTGPDPTTKQAKKCLGYNQKTGEFGFIEHGNGALGAMGGLIAMLYHPPISSGDYFGDLAKNFGIAKPAYAQGVGFGGLKPLLDVWKAFRNLVYVLFAVAFVLIGLAIMLRIHIDPRTVMTIQNQIPKLIIALILVTFSYAIAGFLVDMMYVMIFLIFGLFHTLPGPPGLGGLDPLNIQGHNPFQTVNDLKPIQEIAWEPASTIGVFIGPLFDNPAGKLITGTLLGFLGKFIGNGIVDLLGGIVTALATIGFGPAGAISATVAQPIIRQLFDIGGGLTGITIGVFANKEVIGLVGSIIAFVIISIAILWALFRLWFALILAYVLFLIDVIFAPFWILAGVLPGAQIGFGAWLRSALSNLSPFPVTIMMFLLAKILMESFQKLATTGDAFVPPLIGASTALSSFIGVGFILLTPQVVTMMKDFLKSPTFKYFPAIGQAIGVGTGAVQAPFKPLVSGITFLGGQQFAKKIFPFLK